MNLNRPQYFKYVVTPINMVCVDALILLDIPFFHLQLIPYAASRHIIANKKRHHS